MLQKLFKSLKAKLLKIEIQCMYLSKLQKANSVNLLISYDLWCYIPFLRFCCTRSNKWEEAKLINQINWNFKHYNVFNPILQHLMTLVYYYPPSDIINDKQKEEYLKGLNRSMHAGGGTCVGSWIVNCFHGNYYCTAGYWLPCLLVKLQRHLIPWWKMATNLRTAHAMTKIRRI